MTQKKKKKKKNYKDLKVRLVRQKLQTKERNRELCILNAKDGFKGFYYYLKFQYLEFFF